MKCSPEKAERGALRRVVLSLERAEEELPKLAAPDGTVAVNIDDLRSVIIQMDRMRDTLALGKQFWTANWYGSDPGKGSSIWTVGEHGERQEMLVHVGPDEAAHKAAGIIVAAHNAALNEAAA